MPVVIVISAAVRRLLAPSHMPRLAVTHLAIGLCLAAGVALPRDAGAAARRTDDASTARRPVSVAPRTESLDPPRHLTVRRYQPHVELGWTHDGGMTTGFEVERAIVAGTAHPRPDQFRKIGAPGREARSFRDPTSRPGMTYRYRLRAVGTGAVSPYSSEVIVRITAARDRR
jgi:hypothetical protein